MSFGWKWLRLHILPVLLLAFGPCGADAQSLDSLRADIDKCEAMNNPDEAIAACTRLVYEGTLGPANLAIAFTNRGSAWGNKRDYERAIADFDEALLVNPEFVIAYYNRALARTNIRDYDGLITDLDEVMRRDPLHADAHNSAAWVLATAPVMAIRNGTRAVELARKAAELTNWKKAHILQTLAAAYAETGNFSEAVRWQNKALEFPEHATNFGQEALRRIEFYQKGQPYRAALNP